MYTPRCRPYVFLAAALAISLSTASAQVGAGGLSLPTPDGPVYLRGNIVLTDGKPVPEILELQLVCLGQSPQKLGNANPDGSFSITIDRMPAGGNCDVQAQLNGYISASVSMLGRRTGDNPDLGDLTLSPITNPARTSASLTSLQAPEEAKQEYAQALESIQEEDWGDAKDHLEETLDIYNEHAEAWYQLGRIHERENDLDDAAEAYENSLEADSQFVLPLLRLASMALDKQDMNAVLRHSSNILQINPDDYPTAYYFYGVANLQTGDLAEAEAAGRRALELDPNNANPRNHYLMGFVFAQTGRLQEAQTSFNTYLELAPNSNEANIVRQVLAQIEQDLGQN